ncbi:MAG: hypothetical protein KatS3mg078_2038 [Deltaproteobacteria bacterium]|nr:MAG: hypothetical protein KatS3mg078_2038 [Deltaproteobacteria bacterium]
MRLLRGASVIKTLTNMVNNAVGQLEHVETPSAGTYTYKVQGRNTVQGGVGIGASNRVLVVTENIK